jgi:hypothetical protein
MVAGFGQPVPDGVNTCVIDGVTYTNIFDVHTDSSGGVVVLYKGGVFEGDRNYFSGDFLKSWGISASSLSAPAPGISTNQYTYYSIDNIRLPTAGVQTLSPKVRELIERRAEADQLLRNILREATTKRLIVVYYFYTEDATAPSAYHVPMGTNLVIIAVRENQKPLDQLIQLVFETVNSERDDKMKAIGQLAALGRIGREDFAAAIAKEEFAAWPKTRAFVNQLRLSKQEMAESESYQGIARVPPDFETYLSQMKEASLKAPWNYLGTYEAEYDAVRPIASSAPQSSTTGGWPLADGINTCVIGGVSYTNIVRVHADSSGGIIILHKAGGITVRRSDLSSNFLQSWGISTNEIITNAIITYEHTYGFINNRSPPTALVQMLSPKVREFIGHHVEADQLLADVLREIAPNFFMKVCYFYTEDGTASPAYHFPVTPPEVVIAVCEDEKPVDELIELVFEIVSLERDAKMQPICQLAAIGRIEREEFVAAMIKEEFGAYLKTWTFLNRLRLTKEEMAESVYFRHFAEAPQDLGAFMSYMRAASLKGRDVFKEFEVMYDALRPQASSATPGIRP